MSIKEKYIAAEQPSVLTREAFEEIAASWDGCTYSDAMIPDIGAALRADFKRLARQSPAPEKNEEILALHRALAGEKLRADQGWERAEAKSKECNELRERMAAQEVAQPMHKDVEWLVEAADMARRNPDLATKMRQNCKAGHAVQEVEPGSAPAAADEVRDGWISVDERLPEDDCRVLAATWFTMTHDQHMDIVSFRRGSGQFSHSDVTHWMPLPAAPEVKTTASAATSADGGAA